MFRNDWKYYRYSMEDKLEKLLRVGGSHEYGYGVIGLLRQWLKEHKRPACIVLCSLTLVFVLYTVSQLRPGTVRIGGKEPHKNVWFYDLNTGGLFAAKFKSIPPIEAPSGPLPDGQAAGVRAYVYKYIDQSDEEKFVAYIEKFTPQAAEMMKSGDKETRAKAWKEGRLVRRTNGTQWVNANSKEGQEIIAFKLDELGSARQEPPIFCFPN